MFTPRINNLFNYPLNFLSWEISFLGRIFDGPLFCLLRHSNYLLEHVAMYDLSVLSTIPQQ